jgi:formylglycine-generating enzyme required for sulfatase activity
MLTPNPLQPGQKIGLARFTLIRQLGQGGMGVVWLAQDERLGESVALKFLPPEVRADPVALDDLRRETLRSRKLSHPHIVRIHDFHEVEGEAPFISMEYVDGPNLVGLRMQQADRVLTWELLRPLVKQLCAALDYAHTEGVIHRDLKPANVMLDRKGRLKLADFGIAAIVSDSLSRVSMQKTSGTLAYMSPQQLVGKRPAVADDIYALGATLYELLTSKPPFYTGDLTHQILHEANERPEERLAALGIANPIPADVAGLVMACLAKEPGQRPQSAQAVAACIGLELGSQPVAEKEGPVQARPNRKRLWAGVALAVFGFLGLVVWYGAIHGRRTRLTPVQTTSLGGSAAKAPDASSLSGMVLIPAGAFTMGDTFSEGLGNELPLHTVEVSAFYLDKTEVTKGLWDEVYNWAKGHGYSFDNPGWGQDADHPVDSVTWYDAVKWCNARSEMEGRVPAYYTDVTRTTVYRSGQVKVQNDWVKWNSGYRLPTEAEWEKAARGGLSGKRFSWGDTITHSQANYCGSTNAYDISSTRDPLPIYPPFEKRLLSPVGSFTPNGYGLYDMAGNLWEWCWDWSYSYSRVTQTDPRGPSSGSTRVIRGGSWDLDAFHCRAANRYELDPFRAGWNNGFRSALPAGQP